MIHFLLKILLWLKTLFGQMKLAWNAVKLQAGTIPESLKGAPRYFKVLMIIVIAFLVVDGVFLLYIGWQVRIKDVDDWELWGGYYSIVPISFLYGAFTTPMLQWRSNHLRLPELSEEGRKEWKRITKVAFTNSGLWIGGLYLGLFLGAVLGKTFASIGLLASVLVIALLNLGASSTALIGVASNQYVTQSQTTAATQEREQARTRSRAISHAEFLENRREVLQVRWAKLVAAGGTIPWIIPPALVMFLAITGTKIEGSRGDVLVILLTSATTWGFKLFIEPLSAVVTFRFKMSYWPRSVADLSDTYKFALRLQKLSVWDTWVALGIYSILALMVDKSLGSDDPFIHAIFLGIIQVIGSLFFSGLMAAYASDIGRKKEVTQN